MLYKIYKITCLETGEAYYGKTSQKLNERMRTHRKKNEHCSSKRIIERGNYKVDILETCDESNSVERESYYIRNFDCINCQTPGRSRAEYHLDNKEKMNKQARVRHHNNKDECNKISREYHHNNKERLNKVSREYRHNNIERLKQYRLDNKEHINERKKQYRLDNKEHIKYYRWWSNTYHLGILARNYFD